MLVQPYSRARVTSSTDSSFASKIPTATKPSGDGVIPLGSRGQVPGEIHLLPFGAGSDDNTFSLRVIGWQQIPDPSTPATGLWVPTVLADLTATLSTIVGVDTHQVVSTDRFADIITVNQGVAVIYQESSNVAPARAVVSTEGYDLLEITFTTGSSATNCNTLYKMG